MREQLADIDQEILCMDGYDDCIVGYVEQFGRPLIALYDRDKVLLQLTNEFKDANPDETEEEAMLAAWEWYEYNQIGSYLGEYTPAFAVFFEGEKE